MIGRRICSEEAMRANNLSVCSELRGFSHGITTLSFDEEVKRYYSISSGIYLKPNVENLLVGISSSGKSKRVHLLEKEQMTRSAMTALLQYSFLFKEAAWPERRCMPVFNTLWSFPHRTEYTDIICESDFDKALEAPVSKRALNKELHENTPGILRRKAEFKRKMKIRERLAQKVKSKAKKDRRLPDEFKEPNDHTIDVYMKKISKKIQAEALFDGVTATASETFVSFVDYVMNMLDPLREEFSMVLDIFRPLAEFVYLLYRSRNLADMIVAADLYGQLVCAKYPSLWHHVKEKFISGIMMVPAFIGIQSESFSDKISEYRALLGCLLSSELIQTIRNFTLSLVSLQLFSKDITKSIITFVGKPDKMNIAELFSSILDQFLVVLRIGESLTDGTPFHTCLMAKNPLSQFIDDSTALLFYQDKLYLGLPVDGMMCYRQFITDVNRLIVVGEAIVLKTSPFAVGMSKFREKILALRQAKFEVELRSNNSSRPVPFGLILHGDPGIGKGRLLPFIAALWSRVKGRIYDDSHIFHRTVMSEYWENYQPFSQPIIHYSEVGSMHKDLAKTKGDVMATEVCSLMDSLPFYPNMAFKDKGAIAAQPEFVIIDTNNPAMNLDVLVNNKAAHQRRFLYVEPIVKPEFRIDGSTSLDPNKSFDSLNDKIMDRWLFRVYYYRPVTVSKAEKVVLMHATERDDIFMLVEVLVDLFEKHIKNQEAIMQKSTDVSLDDYLDWSRGLADEKGDQISEGPIGYFGQDHLDDVMSWFQEEKVGTISSEADYKVAETIEVLSENEIQSILNRVALQREGERQLPREVQHHILGFGIPVHWSLRRHISHVTSQLHGDYLREIFMQSWQWIFMFASNFSYLFGVFLAWILLSMLPTPNTTFPKKIAFLLPIMWNMFSLSAFVMMMPLLGMLFLIYSHMFTRIMLQVLRERVRGHLRHRYEYFLHLIGFNVNYNPFESPWWRRHRSVTIALSVVISSFAVLYYHVRKVKKKAKKDLDEYFRAEAFGTITNAEQEMECGKSFKRIATKDHMVWNVQQLVLPPAAHKDSVDTLSLAFERNSRQVQVKLSDGDATTYLFGICGNFAVINTHALGHEEKVTIRVSNIGVDKDLNRVWFDTVLTSGDRIDLGNDISLIRVKMTQFRDVRPHLCTEFVPQRTVSGYFADASVRINALVLGAYHLTAKTGDFFVDSLYKYDFPKHAFGDCGKPLYMVAPGGSVFAGIHTGGKGSDGYSVPVLRKDIDFGIEELSKSSPLVPLVSEGSIIAEIEFSEPVHKSPVRFIPLQGINYFGKIKDMPALIKGFSRLRNTKMGDDIRNQFFEEFSFIPSTEFGKPMMMPKTVNGEYISPYNVMLNKLATQKGSLDGTVLSRCIKEYSTRIVMMLKARGIDNLHPIDMHTAINGDAEDAFLRRINVTTAAGYGFKGKKSKFLPIVSEEPLVRLPVPELSEKINKVFDSYDSEQSYGFIFNVSLKDEARDVRKIVTGKTRPFYVIPLEGLITSRMLLAPFYTAMVQHGDIFGTAVGINIVSNADGFLKHLLKRSDLIMEGDYGNFDQCMPFDIGWAAYTVIYEVLSKLGYNETALKTLRGLITDLLFPYIQTCADLFSVPGLQPSGMYGTAENNSLRGVLMLMYAFYSNPKLAHLDFFEHVTPVTFGDDVLATVDEKIADEFNNHAYAAFCERVYKLTYTSAAKDGTLKKFVSKTECSFLKRTFKYREDINFTTALLNLDSIVKSLEWYIPSNTITTEEQIRATLTSALWEIATRTTREQYDRMRRDLVRLVAEHFTSGELFDTPSWDEIIGRIKGE